MDTAFMERLLVEQVDILMDIRSLLESINEQLSKEQQ